MRNRFALTTAVLLGVLVAGVWAQPPWARSAGRGGDGFQGYWIGVDPTDGGDARRSLVRLENGSFALAARDSFFHLCDGTDRGFGSFDDGVLTGPDEIESNTLTLRCFNTNVSVLLRVRFELIGKALMIETATTPEGNLVSRIVFHRVSQD
jgi:hypothetical protein